ncbi:MAG: carbohydrate kinase family protein [Nitrososphaeria archaeon]|nr:carbohydrate kinase family protein [Nitrososphaeria archaeon]
MRKSMRQNVRVVVVGHFSLDENVSPKGSVTNVLGGAPIYSGSTFSKLGVKAGICSCIGEDQYERAIDFCKSMGIDYKGLRVCGTKTLYFRNNYDEKGDRIQNCYNVPRKLSPKDLPKEYLKCSAYYISPLMNEVTLNFLDTIRFRESVLMLDPQGIMRKVGEDGKVSIVFEKERLIKFFEKVDIVKFGKDEAKAVGLKEKEILKLIRDSGAKIGIVTRGKDPVIVSHENGVFETDTIDVNVEDPTGAGDVFGAAFLTEYLESKDIKRAVKFANIAAGLKIRFRGPEGFPTLKDIELFL